MAPDIEREKRLLKDFVLSERDESWRQFMDDILTVYELVAKAAKGDHGGGYFYDELLRESGMVPRDIRKDDPEYMPAMRDLWEILGMVSEFEVSRGRPMLSAVVVDKDTGLPGGGFFKLAYQLELLDSVPADDSEKRKFWGDQLSKIRSVWRGQ